MTGDFSRSTFDPRKHYSSVQMQQGRVQLDSDWNEQAAITAHRIASESTDVVGLTGAPLTNPAFSIFFRNGIEFPGEDSYFRAVPNQPNQRLSFPGNTPFTIEVWLNPYRGNGTILSKFHRGNLDNSEYYLGIEEDGTLAFHRVCLENGNPVVRSVRSRKPLPFGKFSHAAVAFNNGNCKIYINWERSGLGDWDLDGAPATDTPFLMGALTDSSDESDFLADTFFEGIIDDIRLWNIELTPTQIREQAYTPLSGNEEGLVGYWDTHMGEGDDVDDLSAAPDTNHLNTGKLLTIIRDEVITPPNVPPTKPRRVEPSIWVSRGRYYVQGELCEVEDNEKLFDQPDLPMLKMPQANDQLQHHLVYLDVWQRSISALQDESIREIALGGPDTTTRTKNVWQLKLMEVDANLGEHADEGLFEKWDELVWRSRNKGKLRAQRQIGNPLLNQLYRVQVHDGGGLYGWPRIHDPAVTTVSATIGSEERTLEVDKNQWNVDSYDWGIGQLVEVFSQQTDQQERTGILSRIVGLDAEKGTLTIDELPPEYISHENIRIRRIATLKWSRENGSIAFPIDELQAESNRATLGDLGQDTTSIKNGDWVEIVDDDQALTERADSLSQVTAIEPLYRRVTLSRMPYSSVGNDSAKHPILRRWDQIENAANPLRNGVSPARSDMWLDVENGIQVRFTGIGYYQPGDYWLIPSRTLKEDIEWPRAEFGPLAIEPHGTHHKLSPIALLAFQDDTIEVLSDYRQTFEHITTPYVKKSGDTMTGDLKVEGEIQADSIAADRVHGGLISGNLSPDMVGTDQIQDKAVTTDKLADVGAFVPPGFCIMGETMSAPQGFSFSGSTVAAVNHDPSWQTRAPIPSVHSQNVYCAKVNEKIYAFTIPGEVWEYNPLSNEWQQKADMPNPRSAFALVTLGNAIHLIGGLDNDGTRLALHEAYDPETDTWDTRASMPTPRSSLGSGVIDGRIYAVGGEDPSGEKTPILEAYNPDTDSWQRRADMPTPRSHLGVGVVNDRLYTISGERDRAFFGIAGEPISGENEVYRPDSDTWDSNRTHIPTPRMNLSVVVVNNWIYAIGGLGREGITQINERFDPPSNTWTNVERLPAPRETFGIAELNGSIYAIGGNNPSGRTQVNEAYSVATIFYVHRKD